MEGFICSGLPARVIFGKGTRWKIGEELSRLNCSRALVLSTPEQSDGAQEIAQVLGDKSVGVFAQAAMHTPAEITELAVTKSRSLGADCTIALGGGSTTGLGKAIALRTDLPQIVIPTTYAGSEMTPILGETQLGKKTTQRTLKVLPEVVIYDVELTLTLPRTLSATSGMNAIAHAVEALYAQERNPIASLIAQECVRALAQSLPIIVKDPTNPEARGDALYGAWLGGTCLGLVGMALHHKLCHVLGGAFNLPHAETHTVVLPHVIAYNAPAAPQAMELLRRAVGAHYPAAALFELSGELGAKRSLRELGMRETDIDKAADLAVESPYWNPRPIERAAVHSLVGRAWAGRPPGGDGQ